MIKYSNILAVVDPERESQPALSRALELAAKTKATVTAFMTIYDFSYEMTTMLSSQEREAMREAVIKDRTQWLVEEVVQFEQDIKVQVFWSNRPYEAIIKHVIKNNVDIVVKASRAHDDLKSIVFTPTDWHLLRKCPVPVLLVKDHGWPSNGNIVAAVNVGTEDNEHAMLNDEITQLAKDYASLLSGEVHLANSYPSTPLNIAIEVPEFDANTYNNSVKNHHISQMEKHSEKFSIPMANCHVKEGLPEAVIPRIAKNLDAELVIIGTVGRVGLSAVLIGNTAEHVIDALNCDVLAVKPEGFESPVR
jgi:universal stress protein E